MTAPKICSWLGVQVGQSFWISGVPYVEYQILEDGTFATKPENESGSSYWLLRLIEQPDKIRLTNPRRWTKQDRKDAKAIKRLFPNAKEVNRDSSGFINVFQGCSFYAVNKELFPSIKQGELVAIKDILESAQ